MKDFSGRVAVVTGAADGIGRAIARQFTAEGMKVVLADVNEILLDTTAAELRQSGADVLAVRTDVSRAEDVDELARKALEAFGAVHLVCNNAGVGGDLAWSWEHSLETWRWVLGVNLWGVIHGMRAFLPIMLRQDMEGHVVNTASISGMLSLPFFSVYHATKHAVVTLSESLHFELAMQNAKVKVSVLCPGPVQTGVMDFERTRPSTLQSPQYARNLEAQAWYDAWCTFIASGMPPEEVAVQVLQAIREERFYVFPQPEFLELVHNRTETMLQNGNPVLTLAPEVTASIEEAKRKRRGTTPS